MDQFYGDRSGQREDPFGHLWWVATHKEDVARRHGGRLGVIFAARREEASLQRMDAEERADRASARSIPSYAACMRSCRDTRFIK